MSLSAEYFVRWRSYTESCRVMEYDRQKAAFTPTPYFDPFLEREITETEIAFLFKGDYILFLSASGLLETGRISCQVMPNEYPRLEFCRQSDSVPEVLATVSGNAILRVPDFREGEFDPSEDDCFNFFDTIQLSRAGLIAASFREVWLLVDNAGKYVEDNGGEVIEVSNTQIPTTLAPIVPLLVDSEGRNLSPEDPDLLKSNP